MNVKSILKKWMHNLGFINMLYSYDKKVDDYLLSIMNDPNQRKIFLDIFFKFQNTIERCPKMIPIGDDGAELLWLDNYPYAYATISVNGSHHSTSRRGSRKTIYEFKKFIDNLPKNYPEYFL